MEDLYGRPCITTPVLKTYKYWFEKMVSGSFEPNFPIVNGTFINATEGGIVHKGWLIQNFEHVIPKYLTKTYEDLSERVKPKIKETEKPKEKKLKPIKVNTKKDE